MIWRWFSSNETVKWSWSDSQGSYGDAVYVLFFAHARSSGVDKLKLCNNKPSDLSSRSVWLNYLFTEWVLCAELRWMYYDQDIIITEDSLSSLGEECVSFYGLDGSWFLSSPGTRRANSCWRKNVCFIRLLFFFSVYCVFSGDKPVEVKFFVKMLVERNKSSLCVPSDKFL